MLPLSSGANLSGIGAAAQPQPDEMVTSGENRSGANAQTEIQPIANLLHDIDLAGKND
jgi:hypothetical protein